MTGGTLVGASELRGFRERMDELIRLSGEINFAVARSKPAEDVIRMTRAMLWLTLAFAFDGFVQRAFEMLGSASGFRAMRRQYRDWPDVLIRLKVMERDGRAQLHLPGEPWERVVKRHYRLRNKSAHGLGIVDRPSQEARRIAEWDPVVMRAWVSEPGWSEFSSAVDNLANQLLAAAGP
jgi:hypothetical protein